MILSHRHRFIFIKTSKTAGTSVEIALSRFCGPEDIITPVSPADERLRGELGGKGPQNHLAPLWEHGPRDLWKRFVRGRPRQAFYNHMPAREIRARIPPQVWSGYYKFCFERNPWDRLISLYYWRHPSEPRPSIAEFVRSGGLRKMKEKGWDLYTMDGEVVVDRLCRYENLEADLEAVRRHLGLPRRLELPRAKGGFRKDRRGYRELLGEAERERIAEAFADEIALLGYRF